MNHEDIPEERARVRAIVESAHTELHIDPGDDHPYVVYECFVDGKKCTGKLTKLLGCGHTEALGDMVESREMIINRVTEDICRELHPEWDSLQRSEWQARNMTYLDGRRG